LQPYRLLYPQIPTCRCFLHGISSSLERAYGGQNATSNSERRINENLTLHSVVTARLNAYRQQRDGPVSECIEHREYLNFERNHICIGFRYRHCQWQWEHWRYHDRNRERSIDAYYSPCSCNKLKRRTDPSPMRWYDGYVRWIPARLHFSVKRGRVRRW
jgi:hypothetical protein